MCYQPFVTAPLTVRCSCGSPRRSAKVHSFGNAVNVRAKEANKLPRPPRYQLSFQERSASIYASGKCAPCARSQANALMGRG